MIVVIGVWWLFRGVDVDVEVHGCYEGHSKVVGNGDDGEAVQGDCLMVMRMSKGWAVVLQGLWVVVGGFKQ